MADTKLVGQNYTTPDLVAKVTGRAKYAEDYRVEGMLFAKLLLSPMPHAKVTNLDVRAALAMPGVKAILTADDLPAPADSINDAGVIIKANVFGEPALTNEPVYRGEPVLAVAAIDELTAAEAIERIEIRFAPLPFNVDPVQSLRPGAPNARTQGNTWMQPPAPSGRGGPPPVIQIRELKWTEQEFAEYEQGRLPKGKGTQEWSYGEVQAGFDKAALVLDETFVTPNTHNQPLESRSALAYWQNGKLYLHGSTQSVAQTVPAVARWVGMSPKDVVVIGEYCGGAFGSKVSGAISMVIPALLSKKANAPVMMRISREDEHFIGRVRCGLQRTGGSRRWI
jgi:xanthine dehydrogenase molybdenum-binding subunit